MDWIGSKKNEKKLNKKKVAKVAVLLFIIVLIITFVILYSTNTHVKNFFDKYIFRKEVFEEDLPLISLDGIRTDNVYAFSNYIVVLNQNKLNLYNKYGNIDETLDVDISVPIFSGNGKYLCIAEKGGQKIFLIQNKTILWQKEINGNIEDITVNENGYVAISISGTSYKTVVDVFDAKGEELFKKYLSSSNVIAVDISKDNKHLAIAEANFSGITIASSIEIISMEKAQSGNNDAVEYVYDSDVNDLIINIKYQGKDKLVCLYDNKVKVIHDKNCNDFITFTQSDTLFADVNLNNKMIKIIKNNTGILKGADIQIIDISNNQNVNIYSIDDTPKQIYTNGNNIFGVNLGTEALFINNSGWLLKQYKSNQEIEKIVIGDGVAGVISRGKIRIVSF